MWRRSWVCAVDDFVAMPWAEPFRLVQNQGQGLLIQGNREWRDICVSADVKSDMASQVGIAVRVQGLQRYYALVLHRDGEIRIVKMVSGEEIIARQPFHWSFGETYQLSLVAQGDSLIGSVDGKVVIQAMDSELRCGGMALLLEEGSLATQRIQVAPANVDQLTNVNN